MKSVSHVLVFILVSVSLGNSCIKKENEIPELSNNDPLIEVTHSISAIHSFVQNTMIEEECIISGIVIADDKSGNIFKKIIIQDSTGGLELLVDQNNLFNDFPIGRRIFVNLKHLYFGNYAKNPQIGFALDDRGDLVPIPYAMIEKHIIKGSYNNEIIPKRVAISDLENPDMAYSLLNVLIELEDVEFVPEHSNVPFAKPLHIATNTNRTLKDCSYNYINIRTSAFADFYDIKTPVHKGTVRAIYTRYNNIGQLQIRNLNDLGMYKDRCEGALDNPGELIRISIDSLRRKHSSVDVHLSGIKISGIVISDKEHANINNRNIILQGSAQDKGIILIFNQNVDFALGDSIEVELQGAILKEQQNKLMLTGLNNYNVIRYAENINLPAKTVTISELIANRKEYESTLVRIENINFQTGVPTFNGINGVLNFYDATGSMRHYTSSNSSFANDILNHHSYSAIQGYVEIYYTYVQLRMRYPFSPIYDLEK